MEEEKGKKPNPLSQYFSGFNKGYAISRDHPDLAENIKLYNSDKPFVRGLRDGQKQFDFDKNKERRPEWTKDKKADRQPTQEKSKDRDKER